MSKKIQLTIDDKSLQASPGTTILEAAKGEGIKIPTLCYDPRLDPFTSCFMCLVEVEGMPRPTPACSTCVAERMRVRTRTEKVTALRRMCLELLLSSHSGDCLAPCRLACPAGIDIQGYLALARKGYYQEALKLIKETNPLPIVCGRICPRFCERECRRNVVDEPVAVDAIKRFLADFDMKDGRPYTPSRKPSTGKRVAVIGSGPGGLSAAYFLAREGHQVTIFDGDPEPGGMLRYGIPEYRLPKKELDREIATIAALGVKIECGRTLGKDITIDSLRKEGFDAIFLAMGAQKCWKMGIEGEELGGIIPGLEFLRQIALNGRVKVGKRVAVIGGGNTAIDAARSALRSGADEVTIVYRRSRKEMPAEEEEIDEAEKEGVRVILLAAPVRANGKNNKVRSLTCQRMRLGEPDASGRARPEPIPDSEFEMPVETVIAAIGQYLDRSCLDEMPLQLTKRGYIEVDDKTMETNSEGVFAGGDCVSGPATAVEAIACGRRAAHSINQYLAGKKPSGEEEVFHIKKGELDEIDPREYAHVETIPRGKMRHLALEERKMSFAETQLGFTEDMVKRESERCISCGCDQILDCRLREYALELGISSPRFKGKKSHYPPDESNPFILRDPDKCILCGQCVAVCSDVQMCFVLDFVGRGLETRISTGLDRPLPQTPCVFCGSCVSVCPVGALTEKEGRVQRREFEVEKVRTICPYCGCGCSIILNIENGRIVKITSDPEGFVNEGWLCAKGKFGFDFVDSPDRLKRPLIKKGGELKEVSWNEALTLVTEKLSNIKERCGSDSIAGLSSAKCTNEENYLFQKFMRAALGTNNVDHCARLCHASTVAGLARAFGSGAMTNSMREIENADCILITGSNTSETHPIIALKIKEAVRRNGARLIVADPRKIEMTQFSHLHLRQKPGTDVALFNGMMNVIISEGLYDKEFVSKRCEEFQKLEGILDQYTPDYVEGITGVSARDIIYAARMYAKADRASIIFAMGITQHTTGTDNVLSLANLAMLTGNVGKESSGVNPLRGQNNVQGACDMGALPNVYPGYQSVSEESIRKKFEHAWGVGLSQKVGLTAVEMMHAAEEGKVKAMYIMGENPFLSDPNINFTRKALRKLDFLVVQDIFPTETSEYADVILPAASFAEKEGTFTNTERRVQRIKKAIEVPGEAKADWEIISDLAAKLGYPMKYRNSSQIMDEIASVTPIYGGISHERLDEGGLQWPCPDRSHPGTKFLHQGRFTRGLGKFHPTPYREARELPDEGYPLILTTGRVLFHFHTGTMTRRVKGLEEIYPQGLVEIHPLDAEKLSLKDGDMARVISRRGRVVTRVKVTEISLPGVVFMSFHFKEAAANLLTIDALDPVAKIPELKVCAVRVEKCGSSRDPGKGEP